MLNKVFGQIDTLYPHYLDLWEEFCNIESPTNYKPGVDAAGAFCAKIAKEKGWTVETLQQPVSGDVVCITMNPDAEGSMVCLSGHMDTVHPVGSFGTPAVRRDDQKMYGPGVTDCKGGIIASLLAMDALNACGFADRPIRLLLQTDEENGSKFSNKATIGYICEKSTGARAFLNMEPARTNEAIVERKGIITYDFIITGQEAHASKCAEEGASAIAEAAYKILEMEKLKDKDGLTCSCGLIHGGSASNTVPGKCVVNVNIRYATKAQLEWVKEYAQKVANTTHIPGCSCQLQQASFRVAMERVPRNLLLLEELNNIWGNSGLSTLVADKCTGGSDAADMTAFGVPCIDSIGILGDKIHTPDEFAYLKSLLVAAKRAASAILKL